VSGNVADHIEQHFELVVVFAVGDAPFVAARGQRRDDHRKRRDVRLVDEHDVAVALRDLNGTAQDAL
jgi:hypothetical protein